MSESAPPSAPPPPPAALERHKHIKYWLRCLKTLLPPAYTQTDLSRLSLAFFTLSALDLLGELTPHTTPEERSDWCDWIYNHCQLPQGGFRGSPATQGTGEIWDVPSVPSAYFALACLAILGDDGSRVVRDGALREMQRCQRENGGFGEWVMRVGERGGSGEPGEGDEERRRERESGREKREVVMGGEDMRFVYCAAAARWMLNGGVKGEEREKAGLGGVRDIDVDRAVRFIESSVTYDHGFSAFPYLEPHAGHTYCALGALSLLGKLPPTPLLPPISLNTTSSSTSTISIPGILKWLVSRQAPLGPSPPPGDDDDHPNTSTTATTTPIPASPFPENSPIAGFQGRAHKLPDTCYSFWVGGSLDILGQAKLMDQERNRRFLLEKTQHLIGGFGKLPGVQYRPDILHSYMGLAALSIMDEPGLKRIDPALCVSIETREKIKSWPWFRA